MRMTALKHKAGKKLGGGSPTPQGKETRCDDEDHEQTGDSIESTRVDARGWTHDGSRDDTCTCYGSHTWSRK